MHEPQKISSIVIRELPGAVGKVELTVFPYGRMQTPTVMMVTKDHAAEFIGGAINLVGGAE